MQSQVLKSYIRRSLNLTLEIGLATQAPPSPAMISLWQGLAPMAEWTTAACRWGLNQGGVGTGSKKGSSLPGMQKPLCPQLPLCSRLKAAGGIRLAQQKETRALEFPSSPLRPETEETHKRLPKSLKN